MISFNVLSSGDTLTGNGERNRFSEKRESLGLQDTTLKNRCEEEQPDLDG